MINFYYVLKKEHRKIDGRLQNADELRAMCRQASVSALVDAFRDGNQKAKGNLPAILFQGYPKKDPIGVEGSRLAENLVSNRKYLIDLDHIGVEEGDEWTPLDVWKKIKAFFDFDVWNIQLAFITPSGKGLKVVAEMREDESSILDQQRRFVNYFGLEKWYDEVNIDYSRLSFIPKEEDILYLTNDLFVLSDTNAHLLWDSISNPQTQAPATKAEAPQEDRISDLGKEIASYENIEYRGRKMKSIVEEWTRYRGEQLGIIVNGKPFQGEVHSLHYNILRDIRNLCDNNPAVMTAVVPTFGHSQKEIYAQAKKICAYNNNGRLPTNVWQWMKSKGYFESPDAEEDLLEDEVESPYAELLQTMPELPPIIRDWVRIAPTEFKIPTIAALLEILGCCTTYAEADYFDGVMHTTSFFTVIWAEAAGGKSFVKKFLYLHNKIRNREEIINARERLYDAFVNAKSDNKDAPEKPILCKRILEPKFSEVQLFTQCFENGGAHLHTYCPEIDTLGRGVRGLSDLLRLAWDNDETGQQFRSSQTFKGTVRLFWNLLATGTPERVMAFFPDVLDGLVTRISIMPIFNTEFAPFRTWKALPERTFKSHFKLLEQFDEATYEDPVEDFTTDMLNNYKDLSSFDKNVAWKFRVRPRIARDLSFTHKPLRKWLEEIRKKTSKDVNNAAYTFSKRSANKGFRAALVANELWGNPTSDKYRDKILNFCLWWTKVEYFTTCFVFADEYNKKRSELRQRMSRMKAVKFGNLFEQLPNEFSKNDLESLAQSLKVSSNVRSIVYIWMKESLITKSDKNKWKKK